MRWVMNFFSADGNFLLLRINSPSVPRTTVRLSLEIFGRECELILESLRSTGKNNDLSREMVKFLFFPQICGLALNKLASYGKISLI